MRSRWNIVRVLVYPPAFGLIIYDLWRTRDGLGASLLSIGWRNVLFATVVATAGSIPGFFGWRLLLGKMGTPLPVSAAARIFFPAWITRYLPGGVWPIAVHATHARALRQPPARLVTAFTASQGLSLVAALATGLLVLPTLVRADAIAWFLLPVLLVALLPLAVPPLLRALLGLLQRVIGRGEQATPLPGHGTVLHVTGLMALGWLATGLHVAVLAIPLGASPGKVLLAGVGGFALSVIAGALAVVLPAGLGVREATLGAAMAALLSGPHLVAVVALSRFATTAADFLAAAATLGLAPRVDVVA